VVGRDVSITGFDDILLAEFASPPLTTVHLPGFQLGMLVTEKLVNGHYHDWARCKTDHPAMPQLILRQSTGPKLSIAATTE
jgi:DNA-binding LacI/PurR family transcriptional regulator